MNLAAASRLFLCRQRSTDEEVDTVAATIDIEVESGVFTGPVRLHQGYYAGDFSRRDPGDPD
jgi:hypothetical protein